MPALTESGARVVYEEAVATLAKGLRADRAAIVYLDHKRQLMVGGVFGMPRFHLHDAPISASLLSHVITANRTIVYDNVPKETDARGNLSLQLSGAASLLCIPFYDQGGSPVGALYADASRPKGFHRKELLFARDCARWLEGCLAGNNFVPRPEPETSAPAASQAATRVAEAPKARRTRLRPAQDDRVDGPALMVFFRGFATLVNSGIMIHEGLDLLARSSEDPRLARVLQGVADMVAGGEPLSAAMGQYPRTFPAPVRSAVRVGERTGRLAQVLSVISTDMEKGRHLVYKVRSALLYPAVLSVFCGILLVLGPPFLLEGHLRMLSQSGVDLPWVTQVMIAFSGLMRSPLFAVLLVGSAGMAFAWLRRETGREKLRCWIRRVPLLGPALRLLAICQLTRSVSLQLKAGLTALEALEQARQGCADFALAEALKIAESSLREGASLAESFARARIFSPTFLSFIEAGESSGTLPGLVERLAELSERDLESRLDVMVALLEPMVLGVMGIVATVLLVATLKPTLLLLQTL